MQVFRFPSIRIRALLLSTYDINLIGLCRVISDFCIVMRLPGQGHEEIDEEGGWGVWYVGVRRAYKNARLKGRR